jgi:hypothetical protein
MADSGRTTVYRQIVVSSHSNLGEAAALIRTDRNMPFRSCVILNDKLGSRLPARPLASGLVPR